MFKPLMVIVKKSSPKNLLADCRSTVNRFTDRLRKKKNCINIYNQKLSQNVWKSSATYQYKHFRSNHPTMQCCLLWYVMYVPVCMYPINSVVCTLLTLLIIVCFHIPQMWKPNVAVLWRTNQLSFARTFLDKVSESHVWPWKALQVRYIITRKCGFH